MMSTTELCLSAASFRAQQEACVVQVFSKPELQAAQTAGSVVPAQPSRNRTTSTNMSDDETERKPSRTCSEMMRCSCKRC